MEEEAKVYLAIFTFILFWQ